MQDEYIKAIKHHLEECQNITLLDLILKLLTKSTK